MGREKNDKHKFYYLLRFQPVCCTLSTGGGQSDSLLCSSSDITTAALRPAPVSAWLCLLAFARRPLSSKHRSQGARLCKPSLRFSLARVLQTELTGWILLIYYLFIMFKLSGSSELCLPNNLTCCSCGNLRWPYSMAPLPHGPWWFLQQTRCSPCGYVSISASLW